ncbi:MAG: hypothetical protein JW991_00575 [Candidatus Pacebacteria bacterium]|nr:hypothetical protein [Candidatus Paceibacterota bacterium]
MFIKYLNIVEGLIKQKEYDKAWKVANEALIRLSNNKDDMWFMMYYQMSIILAREKRWLEALEKMGFVIYYLGGFGGQTHIKYTARLLKKFDKENLVDEFEKLAIKTNPKTFFKMLKGFLKE